MLSEAEWCKIAMNGDVTKRYARTELRKITPEEAMKLHLFHGYDGGAIILIERQWGYVGIGWSR